MTGAHFYLMLSTPKLAKVLRARAAAAAAADADPLAAPPRDPLRRHLATRDLPMFAPLRENFFVRNLSLNEGIQCRFAPRGTISEVRLFDRSISEAT